MNKLIIKNILKEFVNDESLVSNDNTYIDEIEKIKNLSEDDIFLENKLDKIWNSLEIKTKKNGIDMSKFVSNVNFKLSKLVNKLSDKSKNPSVWIRRRNICKLWK